MSDIPAIQRNCSSVTATSTFHDQYCVLSNSTLYNPPPSTSTSTSTMPVIPDSEINKYNQLVIQDGNQRNLVDAMLKNENEQYTAYNNLLETNIKFYYKYSENYNSTNKRKNVYETEKLENVQWWERICKYVYWIVVIIWGLYYVLYKRNFSTRTIITSIVLICYPLFGVYVIRELVGAFEFIISFIPTNKYY